MNKPTISINAENIQNTQSLNITLTISTNDGRIASATNSFTIVYNVNADIQIISPGKIRSSSALFLNTNITAPKGLTIL